MASSQARTVGYRREIQCSVVSLVQGCHIGVLCAKFHSFGILKNSLDLEFAFGKFFDLALFWHFSKHGFTKCHLLSFTEFLNNINLNKYAYMVYQRLLKALHYSDINLLINVTALYGHSRSENIKYSAASLPLWRIVWIWHILIQFGINFPQFGIFFEFLSLSTLV